MSSKVDITQSKFDPRLIIDIYSHHFSVYKPYDKDKKMLIDFCRPLGQYGNKQIGRGRFVRAILRVFAVASKDRSQFRFHISQLNDFLVHCKNYNVNDNYIQFRRHYLFKPVYVNFDYHDKRIPRDYQQPIIDYVVSKGKFKVVELDPGRGKTFIACTAMNILKVRTFFCIKAQYIEKWINDLNESFNIKPEDIMVIKGSKNLKRLIELGKEDELNAKVILCSSTTMGMFLKDYEIYGSDIDQLGFGCAPHQIWETLGIGLKVVDESHEFLHFNYRLTLYTHVQKTLDLSGTLIHDDPFIKRVLRILHPPEIRYTEDNHQVHTRVEALFYSIRNVDSRIKYENKAMKAYSHVKLEQSIMKNNTLFDGYTQMIMDIVKKRYVNNHESGQKMIVYFSTKEMCTRFWEIAEETFEELNVVRYIGEDEYEDMLEGDLIVSTLKSLGTAIDIPKLRYILMTDALGSIQMNVQALGRLRPLKDYPGTDPVFMYLVCRDIGKHIIYHQKKVEIFKDRVLSHNVKNLDYVL